MQVARKPRYSHRARPVTGCLHNARSQPCVIGRQLPWHVLERWTVSPSLSMQVYLVTFCKRRESRNNEPVAWPAGTEGEASISAYPAHMPPPHTSING
jgi:hypothetical protein